MTEHLNRQEEHYYMNTSKRALILIGLVVAIMQLYAQNDALREQIESITAKSNARTGVALYDPAKRDTVALNGTSQFPMHSVMKFPIALAVLSEIDKGNLSLKQRVTITSEDLEPDTWSPIKAAYPDGTVLTIEQILKYTVADSDNIGCDILLRLIGGTMSVQKFLDTHGFTGISIGATEQEMHDDPDKQYLNSSSPGAMNKLLSAAYTNTGALLSRESHEWIWKILQEATTGGTRIKGLLPKTAIVAHKTGTSGITDGVIAAVNDVGVLILPDGNVLYLSVFVADSRETPAETEKIIAEIAKAVWDHYAQ